MNEFKFLMQLKRDLENKMWDLFDAACDEAQHSGKSLLWDDLNNQHCYLQDMRDKIDARMSRVEALSYDN